MQTKRRRFSTAQGAAICTLGLVLGLVAWQVALVVQPVFLQVLLLLFAWFALWFFPHDLAHHITGKTVGIRFHYYYVARSPIRKLRIPLVSSIMGSVPVLGLKIDKDSLSKASVPARKLMYTSGVTTSMALPWIIVPGSFAVQPPWVGVFITALVSGYMLFTLYFSSKASDLFRARGAA